jgi:Zn-dependent protease
VSEKKYQEIDSMLVPCFFLLFAFLPIIPEDGSNIFLENVDDILADYTVLNPTYWYSP